MNIPASAFPYLPILTSLALFIGPQGSHSKDMGSKGGSSQDDIAIESAKSKEGVSIPQINPVAERKLVRKLDYILLPLFCLICKCL